MSYIFDPAVALDPVTGELVKNATGQVYDPDDLGAPLQVYDLDGNPKSTVAIGEIGTTEAFVTDEHPRVVFVSGEYQLAITSYSALLEEAKTAATAAQEAQSSAEVAAQAAADAAAGADGLPPGGSPGDFLRKSPDDGTPGWATIEPGTGTVTAVAGVEPDGEGNVPLDATSIGAAPTQHEHVAGEITSGQLAVDRIPELPAGKITSGQLAAAQIPDLPASKITSGEIAAARIPTNLTAYVRTAQTTATAGDILTVGSDKNVTPTTVEPATAADIDYDGIKTVADVLGELLEAVEALQSTGPSITNTAPPVITGTFEVGEEVTVSNGTWEPTPDSYTYEWQRDGVAIPGATSSTYELTASDLGVNRVRAKVTAIKDGNTPGVAYASAITVSAEIEFVGLIDEYQSEPTSSAIVLSRDGTVQEGDYLVAILGSGHNSATADFSAQSGSGTWSRLSAAWPGGSAINRVAGIFGHVVGPLDAEPASYTFAHTPGTATAKAGQLLVFRYVNPGSPVNVAATDYVGTSITNGRRVEGLTVTEDNSIMLFAGFKEGSSSSSTTLNTQPTGMTHIEQTVGGTVGSTSITVIESFYQEVDAGDTGDKDIAWSAATNPRAQAIVLQGV